MPELPEVEVVRAGLEPAVRGSTITAVEVRDPRAITRDGRSADALEAELTGMRLVSSVRRGKFLWMPLVPLVAPPGSRPARALLAHLGMSGQLLVRRAEDTPPRETRVMVALQHPLAGELAVHFLDQRTFGSLAVDDLVPTADGRPGGRGDTEPLVPAQVRHIARDPLDPAFDAAEVVRRMRGRRSTVKRALLDQSLVSGIGNIYADEALWAARVHGDQPTGSLTARAGGRVLECARAVFERALAEGGTSFDAQYVDVNGRAGYFARSLNVYGRAGEPCRRCGTAIRRIRFMNRSSYFCPRCQRKR